MNELTYQAEKIFLDEPVEESGIVDGVNNGRNDELKNGGMSQRYNIFQY